MKRVNALFLIIFAIVLGASFAAAQGATIGSTMENFSLPDVNGKTQALKDLTGKNGAVIIFLSAQCPVVRGYVERINVLADNLFGGFAVHLLDVHTTCG